MKKIVIVIIISLINSSLALSQQDTTKIVLSKEGMTLDALYQIVFNKDLPYDAKNETVLAVGYLRMIPQEYKQFAIYKHMVQLAKEAKDYDGVLHYYSVIASQYENRMQTDNFKLYLDSANLYVDKANDKNYIALFYRIKGLYYYKYIKDGQKNAYENWFHAIDYFKQLDGKENNIAEIFYNMACDAQNRIDTLTLRQIIAKAEEAKNGKASDVIDFQINHMQAIYNYFYYADTKQEKYLDDALRHINTCISLYKNDSTLFAEQDAYRINMYSLAIELAMEHEDYENAQTYLNQIISTDSLRKIHYTLIQGCIYYNLKNYRGAEKELLNSEKMLDLVKDESYYLYLDKIAQMLSLTYEALGNYKQALKYDRIEKETSLNIQNQNAKTLLSNLEFKQQETENKQLKIDLAYQSRAKQLYITILTLCLIILFASTIGFWLRRKNIHRKTALQLQLKDEQAANAELEKYEILSDYKLKELELNGKNKELEELRIAKEALDKQVESFREQLDTYEKMEENKISSETSSTVNGNLCNMLKDDIKDLIINKSHLNGDQHSILNRLTKVNNNFIEYIRKSYNGSISTQYIKYCIGFAIGLTTKDIAEIFSVEVASAHMVRYRLKKKFGLTEQDDLALFLRNGLTQSA